MVRPISAASFETQGSEKGPEWNDEGGKTIYVNIEYHTPIIITPKPVQISDEQLFDEEWKKKKEMNLTHKRERTHTQWLTCKEKEEEEEEYEL